MPIRISVLAFAAALCIGQAHHLLAVQEIAGDMRVRVEFVKRSNFEREATSIVLVGPQPAIELNWRVTNTSDAVLQIPSPDALLAIRISGDGRGIRVRTDWASEMIHHERVGNNIVPRTLPVGPLALASAWTVLSSVSLTGSTKRLDGTAFEPGEYLITLDVGPKRAKLQSGGVQPSVDSVTRAPIRVVIRDLETPERLRQYHLIEAAFYRSTDSELALKHLLALTSMPDASWLDWLVVGERYGEMGRHREAVEIYRRIMPDLIATPRGSIIRECGRHGGCHFRLVARSFAVVGDTATAADLLRAEGRTREADIPALIERLRATAKRAQ